MTKTSVLNLFGWQPADHALLVRRKCPLRAGHASAAWGQRLAGVPVKGTAVFGSARLLAVTRTVAFVT